MATIDKTLFPAPLGLETDPSMVPEGFPETALPEEDIEVFLEDEDGEPVALESDQGPEEDPGPLPPDLPHDANLALYLPEDVLDTLAMELIQQVEEDLESRKEWEKALADGYALLGLTYEERDFPFDGASGVYHSLLMEAVVQFQANAFKELMPAEGPARVVVNGHKTPEKLQRADRVREYMNLLMTDRMEEYVPVMDKLLMWLPVKGSAFKKICRDPALARPRASYVPADDLIVPYNTESLMTAVRITHRYRESAHEIERRQAAGILRDVDLAEAGTTDRTPVQEAEDKLSGTEPPAVSGTRMLYEIQVDINIPGDEQFVEDSGGMPVIMPSSYVVLIDVTSRQVLSIQRNWSEEDEQRRRLEWFVHYCLIPGAGFYGFSLLHLLGGLSKASTGILRQLIDSGTLSNLQGGFKARGVNVRNPDVPIAPGEFRDVDVPGGTVRDAIMPLPYKEPSATLVQLLGILTSDGRRFTTLIDDNLAAANKETPTGTTMALLERGLKVMSAIHLRLYGALRKELRLLRRVVQGNQPDANPYTVFGAEPEVVREDFAPDLEIMPVADPNIFSTAQRITLAQTQLQAAQAAPELHDMREAYRRMYEALGVEDIDALLPPQPEPQPMDPALEAGLLILAQIPQAFPQQDHEAHIASHLELYNLWVVTSTPPVMGAIVGHIMQHISMLARMMVDARMAEQGIPQNQDPAAAAMAAMQQGMPMEEVMQQQQQQVPPEEIEKQVDLAVAELLAQLAPQLSPPPPDDPLVQVRKMELEVAMAKVAADAADKEERQRLEQERLAEHARQAAERAAITVETNKDRAAVNRERIDVQESIARERLVLERMRIAQQAAIARINSLRSRRPDR
jgi:chaperonin GroES